MKRILVFTLLSLLVVGCGANEAFVVTADTPTIQPEEAEGVKEVIRPVLAAAATKAAEESTKVEAENPPQAQSSDASGNESAIAWNESHDAIVLQLREGGGFRVAPSATDLPQWTLYGDGMLIWTDDSTGITPGFTSAVWMGQLSEAEMRELLTFANQIGFWELEPSYSINDESQVREGENGEVIAQPQIMDLPSGLLSLNLTGKQHSVQMYPPNYEKMPAAYQALRQRLLETRPENAFTYTPSSYRLEASRLGTLDELAQGTRNLLVEWSFNQIKLDLVSTTPQTIDSRKGLEVGKFLINSGHFMVQDGVGYEVKLFANPPRPTT